MKEAHIPLSECKILLIEGLKDTLRSHKSGDYLDSERFKYFDSVLPREVEENEDNQLFEALHCGLTFWEDWIDEAEHGWPSFNGVKENEWPVIAEKFIYNLENGVVPIERELVQMFPKYEPPKLFKKLSEMKEKLTSRWR